MLEPIFGILRPDVHVEGGVREVPMFGPPRKFCFEIGILRSQSVRGLLNAENKLTDGNFVVADDEIEFVFGEGIIHVSFII